MSEWTSLAAKVFQDRYDLTAWKWSSLPEDTYVSGAIMEARLASILYPGQQAVYEGKPGWFTLNPKVGSLLHNGSRDARSYGCITFRTIPEVFGSRDLDITNNDSYLNKKGWFRKDWTLSDLVAAGMSASYKTYLQNVKRIWYKVFNDLEWIPSRVAVGVSNAIDIGMLPQMINTQVWASNWGPLPKWLQDPYRQAAWNELIDLMGTLNARISAANLSALNNQAIQLVNSRQFWDSVAKYSGVDLIDKKWRALKQDVKRFQENTDAARDAVIRMNSMIADHPGTYTQAQVDKLAQLKQQIENNAAGLRSQIPGGILEALTEDGVQLGIAPVIVIAIGVAAIAAAATIVATWLALSEKTARLAMEFEHELILQAEKAANEAFAKEQDYILNRQQELQQKLDQGLISPSDFETEMVKLQNRAQAAEIELARRREQTEDIAEAHKNNLNSLRASEVTAGLAQFKGIAIAGAVALALYYLGPAVARKI